MLIFKRIAPLKQYLNKQRDLGLSIGFVPTMGALHPGHISLISNSRRQNDLTLCSIFVNPLQFNKADDLERYPRIFFRDAQMLQAEGCSILFYPEVDEMYPTDDKTVFNFYLGKLDTLFEGKERPGHFAGVAKVVKKLFDISGRCKAYFGLKDYQQCMVIEKLVHDFDLPIELNFCPTIREKDGLAMSSRNVRLNEDERKSAIKLSQMLFHVKKQWGKRPVNILEEEARNFLDSDPLIKTEYFNIVNGKTLEPLLDANTSEPVVAIVASNIGQVRLIDNLIIQ